MKSFFDRPLTRLVYKGHKREEAPARTSSSPALRADNAYLERNKFIPARSASEEVSDVSSPLAYLITWTTYGTWLPGDRRGWVEAGEPGIRAADSARQSATIRPLHKTPIFPNRLTQ